MRARLLFPAFAALLAAGCGGSSPSAVTIAPARTYALISFKPAAPVTANKPTRVSFAIRTPDGSTLTAFKRGPGPHTGVHLILVRRDLAYIVHQHPPIAADGTISQRLTFPASGTYLAVIDVYPKTGSQPNFQLFHTVHVAGPYTPQPLPPPARSVTVNGYRFTMSALPRLAAIQAAFLTIHVTGPNGRPARFTPWFGALAHAIFFRNRSLVYFHTHVCGRGATGCTSTLGGTRVSGTSTTPGKLTVGVLVPVPGTWRLFLQCRVDGRILTAPFTLKVS